jgi:hypothetical protein
VEAGEPSDIFDDDGADDRADVAYVVFSANITQDSGESLLDAMSRCATEGIPEVRLLLSTLGGSVMVGLNLYNILRGMPFRLVTHNAGHAASIGVAVFLAGEDRITCPNGSFMLHGVTSLPPANQSFGARWFGKPTTTSLRMKPRSMRFWPIVRRSAWRILPPRPKPSGRSTPKPRYLTASRTA